MDIREIRDFTGLSQTQFAKKFSIPISTLRKWEQRDSTPASYFVKLLSAAIPIDKRDMRKITSRDGTNYYYNQTAEIIYDSTGTGIKINADLKGVKEENLPLYVQDLFESYYEIVEKFNRDCEYDKKDDIIWI